MTSSIRGQATLQRTFQPNGAMPQGVHNSAPFYGSGLDALHNTYDPTTGPLVTTTGTQFSNVVSSTVNLVPWAVEYDYSRNLSEGDLIMNNVAHRAMTSRRDLNADVACSVPQLADYLKRNYRSVTSALQSFTQEQLKRAGIGRSIRNGDGDFLDVMDDTPDGGDSLGYDGDMGPVEYDEDDGGADTMAQTESRKRRRREKEIEKARMLEQLVASAVTDPVIDLDELEHAFRYVRKADRTVHLETQLDYDRFADTARQWCQDAKTRFRAIKEAIGQDATEMEHTFASAGFQQMPSWISVLPANLTDFQRNLTEAQEELLEEIELRLGDPMHGTHTKRLFKCLYDINERWTDQFYVLSPTLVRSTWNFMGTHITNNNEAKERPFTDLRKNPPVRCIGVRHWGRTRIKNIISPNIKPRDRIYLHLTRAVDAETGNFTHVQPVFAFSYGRHDARYEIEPYVEPFIDNKTVQRKTRLCLPAAQSNYYFIGTVEMHDPNPVRTQNTELYKLAQNTFYTDRSLEESYQARDQLGDLWMHLKVAG
jgi:hypothetical protein